MSDKSVWTFVSNHAIVLLQIAQNPRIKGKEIAEITGITERAVRKIIRDLEREHYISKKKEGRQVFYTVLAESKLRHSCLRKISIGELLQALGWLRAGREEKQTQYIGVARGLAVRLHDQTEQEQKYFYNIYGNLL